jgi:hypothetical protein
VIVNLTVYEFKKKMGGGEAFENRMLFALSFSNQETFQNYEFITSIAQYTKKKNPTKLNIRFIVRSYDFLR